MLWIVQNERSDVRLLMSAIVSERRDFGRKTVQKNKELPKSTSNKPCFKCGEIGNWYQDFPENKPQQEHPQEQEPAPKKKSSASRGTRKRNRLRNLNRGLISNHFQFISFYGYSILDMHVYFPGRFLFINRSIITFLRKRLALQQLSSSAIYSGWYKVQLQWKVHDGEESSPFPRHKTRERHTELLSSTRHETSPDFWQIFGNNIVRISFVKESKLYFNKIHTWNKFWSILSLESWSKQHPVTLYGV